jgi:spermidine synthase
MRELARVVISVGLAVCFAVPTWVSAAERVILKRKSPYTEVIVTENDHGVRILRFEQGGAWQSAINLKDPSQLQLLYSQGMLAAFAAVPEVRRVLVIGLGGGVLAKFAHHRYPRATIDAVDIDPVVVQVARSHFGLKPDARLRVFVEDGRTFVERHVGMYDVVLLDAYNGDDVPLHLTTREFLDSVRRAMRPHGVVISNVWNRGANRLYDAMARTYREVFAEVSVVDVATDQHSLLMGAVRRHETPRKELVARARVVAGSPRLASTVADVLEKGYRPIGDDGADAPLLTDADAKSTRDRLLAPAPAN